MERVVNFEKICDRKILELNKNGYIKGGHNGPYYDKETPVRNTAHWAVTFSKLYSMTSKEKYYNAIIKCKEYLMSTKARPMNAAFFCRYDTKKDFTNGLIGQAWAIEGLLSIYKILGEKEILETASSVFLLHPFDERYKMWKSINVDGSIRGFDGTFNHQLWFCAIGVMLYYETKNKEIKEKCLKFLNNLDIHMRIYNNGLIKHSIIKKVTIIDKLKSIFYFLKLLHNKFINKKTMKYKENGYHTFNLYAFSIINDHGFELDFFNNKKFLKALYYCFSEEMYMWLTKIKQDKDINKMENLKQKKYNIYGFPYNAPGFELPYISKVFNHKLPKNLNTDSYLRKVINTQLEITYDKNKNSFNKNTEDNRTLEARIYEYIRIL